MPYLAMMDRLRAFLKQPTAALVMCGYSFRDEHINEVIVQGLQSTQTAVAFVLLFGPIESYPECVSLARRRANLNLLARNGAVVSGREIKWPEREADAVPPGTDKWVKWVASAECKDATSTAELMIGDFTVFGQLLQQLSGAAQPLAEDGNA